MSAVYAIVLAYTFTIGIVGGFMVVTHAIEQKRDRRWKAEQSTRPTADPEWIAGLYDHPPIFAEVEADLGPIFEAGYERQAQRGRELIEDRAAFDRWLHGGRSS